jgi:anti-anti-sigma factor
VDERLSVDMDQHADGVVLHLAGRLDAGTAPVLAGALEALLGGRGPVSLDLERVVAIDGAGIDLLLDARTAAERNGHELAVTGLQESLRRRTAPAPPPQAPSRAPAQ